jgi:hypothetical protein
MRDEYYRVYYCKCWILPSVYFCSSVLSPTLVFPRERRRLSGFAHGPANVAHEKRVAFPFPAKQTVHRVVAHVQRVAFPLYNSLRLT